jgi:methionyl-tRNA formyltransferase
LKIVFMGTTSFGIPTIDELAAAGHEIVGIVSTPAREKGRGLRTVESEIVLHARKKGYEPVFCPQDLNSGQLVSDLTGLGADIFVVVAFRILPQQVFSIPALGAYNIHASLLPRFRGPAPIQRAIAAGETETGVTVFRIDKGIDTGNIVMQKGIAIAQDETASHLSARLALLGGECIVEAVSLIQNNAVVFQKQDAMLASSASKLVKSEGKIDWDRPARDIHNAIRAFDPFPGTWTFLNGRKLNIERSAVIDISDDVRAPGTVLSVSKDGFDVQCRASGLKVLRVKPEGRKSMGARDFALGRNLTQGTILS